MTNAIQEVQRLGQSVWCNNLRRGLIKSGELQALIDLGVTGVTSNYANLGKVITGSNDYDEAILELARGGKSTPELLEAIVIQDIQAAADLLRPVYEDTGGADGYVSMEISPKLARDTEGAIAEVKRLSAAVDRPNVMFKAPATPEGISALRALTSQGINVDATLIFSLNVYANVARAYICGLEDLAKMGGDPSKVASVASFSTSRVDTAVDTLLEAAIRRGQGGVEQLLGTAAIANAKLGYRDFRKVFSHEDFKVLRERGARVQRPLWAATGVKSPAYGEIMYLEMQAGQDTVQAAPPTALTAFLDHGQVSGGLVQGMDEATAVLDSLAEAGVNMDDVTARLLTEGLEELASSFGRLMADIDAKKARLLALDRGNPEAGLGKYLPDVETAMVRLQRDQVISRIWRGDHTVWKLDPAEITNRLGWLGVSEIMRERVPSLQEFAREIKDAGFHHAVLLGMGGSSLGPEVLRQTFGNAPGYPRLIVLDSTVPAWVEATARAIDVSRSLFLVSSKSGSTTEPNMFYAYFRNLVERAVGPEPAGQHFVAISDPGTPLEKLAWAQKFRRVFLNPPDIGGRYSILSYFGLVPAALTGVDVEKLLERAGCMREGCASCVPPPENPGARLGVIMSVLAAQGRDKLTVLTSPSIGSFGLWVEQLIAESTGKEGKGIIPVAGEPLPTLEYYGDDRLFVYLRLQHDANTEMDAAIEAIELWGHPVLRLDLQDKYDLGSEFFRWEMGTAVAGAALGINPFDQPNVQAAKDMTENVLEQFQTRGRLPLVEASDSLKELLAESNPGDYLAIMAYTLQTPEVDRALAALRRSVIQRYRIATMSGYGPRFLHSTGQLHKGGPGSGLFLQLKADHDQDLPIPGESFTFGVLADAQALGDLEALKTAKRRAVRVHLGPDAAARIDRLALDVA